MDSPMTETPNGSQPAPPVEGAAPPADPAETGLPKPKVETDLNHIPNPLSKNQQKKARKQAAWEARRESVRAQRKEKRIEIRTRKRDEHRAAVAEAKAAGLDPRSVRASGKPAGTVVPGSFVLDCSFDQYMTDKEIKSLSMQVQRCYSENRGARYRTHVVVGSWGGRLKERFEEGMNSTHQYWKGVQFVEGDLGDAAVKAREVMAGPRRGQEIDVLKPRDEPAIRHEDANGLPTPDPEDIKHPDVVYLSAESPYTLDRLEAGTSYVIGGLVDKNREKGLCYRLARERGVRTAKLPIGQYMVMNSRQVLATNHVVEIMLKWLECGDWGEAFMKVMPKRKGGTLKDREGTDSVEPEVGDGEDDGAEDGTDDGADDADEVMEGDGKPAEAPNGTNEDI